MGGWAGGEDGEREGGREERKEGGKRGGEVADGVTVSAEEVGGGGGGRGGAGRPGEGWKGAGGAEMTTCQRRRRMRSLWARFRFRGRDNPAMILQRLLPSSRKDPAIILQ